MQEAGRTSWLFDFEDGPGTSFQIYLNEAHLVLLNQLRGLTCLRRERLGALARFLLGDPSEKVELARIPQDQEARDRSRSRGSEHGNKTHDSQPEHDASRQVQCRDGKGRSSHKTEPTEPHDPFIVGWRQVDQQGQGDCGYRSIAQAIYFLKHGQDLDNAACVKEAAWLRSQAIQHIRKHQHLYTHMLTKDKAVSPEKWNKVDASKNAGRWLTQAAKPDTWIGVAIQALSAKLGTPIIVFKKDGDRVKRYTLAPAFKNAFAVGAKNCKPIVLRVEAGHYTQMAPPDHTQTLPPAWLAEGDSPEGEDLQGAGGKSDSLRTPSLHTLVPRSSSRISKSDAQTPSLRTIARKTRSNAPTRTKLRSVLPTSLKRKQTFKLSGSRVSTAVIQTQDSHDDCAVSRAPDDQGILQWTCPVCGLIKRGGNKSLQQMRRFHKTRHPEIAWNTFLVKPRNVPPVVPSNLIPREQRAWQCPCCDVGLPKLNNIAETHKAVSAHRQLVHPRISVQQWRKLMLTTALKGVPKKSPRIAEAARKTAAKKRKKKLKGHAVFDFAADPKKETRWGEKRQWWCANCLQLLAGHGASKHTPVYGCKAALKKKGTSVRIRRAWKVLKER